VIPHATTSTKGLKIYAQLHENEYERASDQRHRPRATINLHPHEFHGDWNYLIKPTT